MIRTRILLFLLGATVVPLVTWAVILVARGYRPNLAKRQLLATGLLVASSVPDGAQVLVDGQLKSATNSTLNLPPGSYALEIKKSGFSPWQKTLAVEAEVVTRAAAVLFPSVPSLKAITSGGADRPLLSPDGTKVAFLRSEDNLSKLYLLDLTESPLGLISRDPRLVSVQSSEFRVQNLIWSPDSKQILSLASPAAYLVDTAAGQQPINMSARVGNLITDWKQARNTVEAQKFSTLPGKLQEILATAAADLIWSPAENKLLYTATASALIPDSLIKPLPGSSTQAQARNLKPQIVYVYDLVEDRNFALGDIPGLSWFPTSAHLLKVEPGKVTVMEYDGQNPTVVYAGPMESDFAQPYPSGKQLLILTNLNPATSTSPNLYAVSLR